MRRTSRNGTGKRRTVALGLALVGVGLVVLGPARGQQVHRNGFESRTPTWVKGPADAPVEERAHDVTDETAHSGQFSERIAFTARDGTYVHYYYPLGRAPLAEELNVSVWVKANRPGTQLLVRLVLPHERTGTAIDEPRTVMLRGDAYDFVGRWQQLTLRRPLKTAKEQQLLLRTELGRDVDFSDAYVDRLVLNLYGGPGITEAWLDDLEAGPLTEQPPEPAPPELRPAPGKLTAQPPSPRPQPALPPRPPRGAMVELNQDHLSVGGKRFLFRGIRHTDTPLQALREAGFNTVWLDANASTELREEAVNRGFWLVPTLPVDVRQPPATLAADLARLVSTYPDNDAVLSWDLGGGRVTEEAAVLGRVAQEIHVVDPQKPICADVWDGFLPYSRHLDMVGAHRWPLMTNLELTGYREWLNQRRLLARPGTFQWTWIQTHLPEWYVNLVHGRRPDASDFRDPIGPQPEQIRLLTYVALAAGCQGLGFWSDRYLADSHQGRDRLLQMALLNQEMQMLEPLLLSTLEPPAWIDTSSPDVKAAVIRTDKGVLVLPMWLGVGAQFVPGQSAMVKLTLTVPQVPDGTIAWEVSPGDVRSLVSQRVPGGVKVTVPEFGLTTAIVFTADNSPTGLLVRLQDQARRMSKMAAQWSHDLAAAEIAKVLPVEAELERAGHTLPDAKQLQDDARARLKRAEDAWKLGDYRESYLESQRSLRPLRILMRAQWEKAVRELEVPTASPYAVSFFTLPKHWEFRDRIERGQVQANVLPDGGFEIGPDLAPSKWVPQEVTLESDNVALGAWRVKYEPPEPDENKPAPGLTRGQMADEKPATQRDPGGQPLPSGQRSPTVPQPPGAPAKGSDTAKKKKKPMNPKAREGERCLKLEIKPKEEGTPPAALERTFLAINSPAVSLPPGTLVRISAWVMIPGGIGASVDGVLFYDSAGGEPLAVRLTQPTPRGAWKKYTLYRQVPATGVISVTLALTGLGVAYFDDVRIEPLQGGSSSAYHGWTRWGEQPSGSPQGRTPQGGPYEPAEVPTSSPR